MTKLDLSQKGGEIVIRAEDICGNCNYVNTMGFSPDDNKLLLAGNLDGQHVFGMGHIFITLKQKDWKKTY